MGFLATVDVKHLPPLSLPFPVPTSKVVLTPFECAQREVSVKSSETVLLSQINAGQAGHAQQTANAAFTT